VSPQRAARSVVTISASYGAGGSRVGPGLAKRLGVDFVDRAIPTAVSARLAVPLDDALSREEPDQGALSRMLGHFAPVVQMYTGAPLFPEMLEQDDRSFLAATEQVLHEYAARGTVILGRGAAVVLADLPHVMHVRLDGPHERRLAQAMRIEDIDRATAVVQLGAADQARESYVRHWYHVDPRDPSLYHLVIDATAIELDACIELIALAVASRVAPVEGQAPAAGGRASAGP
jgi:cytidylate kinase